LPTEEGIKAQLSAGIIYQPTSPPAKPANPSHTSYTSYTSYTSSIQPHTTINPNHSP